MGCTSNSVAHLFITWRLFYAGEDEGGGGGYFELATAGGVEAVGIELAVASYYDPVAFGDFDGLSFFGTVEYEADFAPFIAVGIVADSV